METIFSIETAGKELILFRNQGKFCYAKKQAEQLVFNLNEAEIKLIKQVLIKLLPSDNLVMVGNFALKTKQYFHFYDFLNGRHHFLDKDKNLPSLNDYIILNNIFNKNEPVIAFKNNYEKGSEYDLPLTPRMKTFLKIGKKVVAVIIVLTSLFAIDEVMIKTSNVYQAYKYLAITKFTRALETLVSHSFNNQLTYEEITETIMNNPNLTPLEKYFYLADKEFLESQLPYLNRDDYLDTLKHLYIIYNPNDNGIVSGEYYAAGTLKYGIQIYGVNNYEESKKVVINHENGHTTSDKEALTDSNFAFISPFYEFLNRQIKNEYKGLEEGYSDIEADTSYNWLKTNFLRLAKLFKMETLRKFHAAPYEKYLIEELLQIIPDINLAYQLFQEFYNYNNSYKALLGNQELLALKSREEWENLAVTSNKNLDSILKKYYEVKFKNELENKNDIEILYLYDKAQAISLIKGQVNELAFMNVDDIIENVDISSWPNLFNQSVKKDFILTLNLPSNNLGNLSEIAINLTEFNNTYNQALK